MNIIDIYNKYYLPESLQMHMLRVAACASLILDNWNGPDVNQKEIIRVSILHDMGNIVKISEDFTDNQNFLEIRKKFFDIYGGNDHELNLKIGKDEGYQKMKLKY